MKKTLFILLVFTLYAFAQIAGVITAVRGEAYIQRDTKLLPAKIGMDIYNKDTLITKEGRLQVEFKDRTVINVGKESRFSVKEYLFEGVNAKADFNMAKGFFRTITGKIGKIAPKKFKIQTKNSTIGIRGTIIVLFTSPIEGDEIACLDGKIAVVSRYTNQMVVVPAGRITFVKPHASPTPPKPLTLMKKGTKVLGGEKKKRQKKSRQGQQSSQQQSKAKSKTEQQSQGQEQSQAQQSSQPQPQPEEQQPAPALQISPEEPQVPQELGDIETESTQALENEKYDQVEETTQEAQSSSAEFPPIPSSEGENTSTPISSPSGEMSPGESASSTGNGGIEQPSEEGFGNIQQSLGESVSNSTSSVLVPENFDEVEQPPIPNPFDNVKIPPAVGASSSAPPPSENFEDIERPPIPDSFDNVEVPPAVGASSSSAIP